MLLTPIPRVSVVAPSLYHQPHRSKMQFMKVVSREETEGGGLCAEETQGLQETAVRGE